MSHKSDVPFTLPDPGSYIVKDQCRQQVAKVSRSGTRTTDVSRHVAHYALRNVGILQSDTCGEETGCVPWTAYAINVDDTTSTHDDRLSEQ
jgi:hypothetical protein